MSETERKLAPGGLVSGPPGAPYTPGPDERYITPAMAKAWWADITRTLNEVGKHIAERWQAMAATFCDLGLIDQPRRVDAAAARRIRTGQNHVARRAERRRRRAQSRADRARPT